MSNGRSNYFKFIIYPESCPDWKEKLAALFVCCYYIVHNKDAKKLKGKAVQKLRDIMQLLTPVEELKKFHVHVLLHFGSVKTLAQVKEIVGGIAANGKVFVCNDYRTDLFYLTHTGWEEKYQYSFDEVQKLGPLPDYGDRVETMKEKAALKDLLLFCYERRLSDFCLLYHMCSFERPDLRQLIEKLTFAELQILKTYMASDYECVSAYEERYLASLERAAEAASLQKCDYTLEGV